MEERKGACREGLGVDMLCRNAPALGSSLCQGNLSRLFSPQMGFYMCLQEIGGWGSGNVLIRLTLKTQIWVNLKLCGEKGRVGWGGRGGWKRLGMDWGLLAVSRPLTALLSHTWGCRAVLWFCGLY